MSRKPRSAPKCTCTYRLVGLSDDQHQLACEIEKTRTKAKPQINEVAREVQAMSDRERALDLEQFEGYVPGPWKYELHMGPNPPTYLEATKLSGNLFNECGDRIGLLGDREMRLITAAPGLIAEVRRLRVSEDALNGALEEVCNARDRAGAERDARIDPAHAKKCWEAAHQSLVAERDQLRAALQAIMDGADIVDTVTAALAPPSAPGENEWPGTTGPSDPLWCDDCNGWNHSADCPSRPESAPSMTDLMVTPESLDEYLAANPQPAAEPWTYACGVHRANTAAGAGLTCPWKHDPPAAPKLEPRTATERLGELLQETGAKVCVCLICKHKFSFGRCTCRCKNAFHSTTTLSAHTLSPSRVADQTTDDPDHFPDEPPAASKLLPLGHPFRPTFYGSSQTLDRGACHMCSQPASAHTPQEENE